MRTKQNSDRLFADPRAFFITAFGLAVAGFWPSFFAILPSTSPVLLVHGFSATLWMLLPLFQAWAVRSGLRQVHRKVGYASLALAFVLVVSGLHVVQLMVLRNPEAVSVTSVKFVWLDLTGLALFTFFLVAAIRAARAKDFHLHVRLLACTSIIPLEAALERLLLMLFPRMIADFDASLNCTLILLETVCAALVVLDWRRANRSWPFAVLLGYYLLMHLTLEPVASDPAFQSFSVWFARLGGFSPPA